MADTYSNRLIGRLTNLANMLGRNGYKTESGIIRTLIGRVGGWKEGREWNEANALTIGDADHVLEEVVKTFTTTINEIARKKLVEKQKERAGEVEEEESPEETELEKSLDELDKAISELM
jgi:predicted ribosome quality control (RQC) complex YloA/Tae2 family protein